jgi:hypothetical protein
VDVSVWILVASSICTAIFASITAPLILSHRTEKMHREDQLEQYRREDLVARKAEEAAAILVASQKEIADKAAEAATDLAESQKRIAEQAAVAARLLLEAQQESIARTDEVARLAAIAQAEAGAKLDQLDLQTKRIHTLVNSDMTAARQSELDQTRAMVIVLERVTTLAARTTGASPDPRDLAALEAARSRISDLEAILADRLAQMRIVEAEQKVNPIIEGDSPLNASAKNLDTSAQNLDEAAASLEAAAHAHRQAQGDLEVATEKLEGKKAELEEE